VPIIVGICVGGVVIFLLVAKCFVLYRQQHRNWNLIMDDGSDLCNIGFQRFTYKELCIATNFFSEVQLLGSGGHGSVYKGFLQETGSLVAVKRITRESRKGESDFIAEISVISQIRHRNLVQLQGWCQEKENLLLVYDYMSNNSLDKWLFETPGILHVQSPHVLRWEVRYNIVTGVAAAVHYLHEEWEQCIVTGVAAAVHYLHEEWEQCIIHRDIKASNVLLDAQFQSHLGDFGLASSQTTTKAQGPPCWLVL
jgi:interleukin-1 receptor-associated kinase 1